MPISANSLSIDGLNLSYETDDAQEFYVDYDDVLKGIDILSCIEAFRKVTSSALGITLYSLQVSMQDHNFPQEEPGHHLIVIHLAEDGVTMLHTDRPALCQRG
jgi:hypothetical protein